MVYSPQTQAAITGLRELKQKMIAADELRNSIQMLHQRMLNITHNVRNAGATVSKLPENNYERLEVRFRNNVLGRAARLTLTIVLGIIVLGIVSVALLAMNYEDFMQKTGLETTGAITSVIIFSIAAVAYSCLKKMSPFGKFKNWLNIGGLYFFLICWCGPCALFVMSVYYLAVLNPLFGAIPIAMLAGMIGCRVIKKTGFNRSERRQLAEAKALDSENAEANKRNSAAAVAEAAEKAKQSLQQIREQMNEKEGALNLILAQLHDNAFLAKEDLAGLDNILYLLETGRAETIKEALAQYDSQKAAQEHRAFLAEMAEIEQLRREIAEMEASFDRDHHNMIMEQEQRRQTEVLEDIHRELKF